MFALVETRLDLVREVAELAIAAKKDGLCGKEKDTNIAAHLVQRSHCVRHIVGSEGLFRARRCTERRSGFLNEGKRL